MIAKTEVCKPQHPVIYSSLDVFTYKTFCDNSNIATSIRDSNR